MKRLRYILGTALVVQAFALTPVMVHAISEAPAATTTTTPKATDDSENTGKKIEEPSTDATAMKKRLEALKTSLKVKLDETTRKRILTKCKPAQTIVETTEKTDASNGTSRSKVYDKVVSKVQSLIDKLKANSVDTTALETALTGLEAKVATFKTDMTTYRQSMLDLRTIDCATDPTAFQAALTTARTNREKVHADGKDIRAYIKDTLKPALQAIKDKLKTEKTGGTQ